MLSIPLAVYILDLVFRFTLFINSRYPIYIENKPFKNSKRLKSKNDISYYKDNEEKREMLNYVKNIFDTLSINNKVILVYPIPEVGFHVPRKIKSKFSKKNKSDLKNIDTNEFITTSYKNYLSRNKSSIDFLDSINNKNIYRIYPSMFFCNSIVLDRCITHDSNKVYYFDDNHLSLDGTKIVNDLLLEKIELLIKGS